MSQRLEIGGLLYVAPQPLHLKACEAYFFMFPITSLIRWVLIIDSTTSFVDTASILSATSICFAIFSAKDLRVEYDPLERVIVMEEVAWVKPSANNCLSPASRLPIVSNIRSSDAADGHVLASSV